MLKKLKTFLFHNTSTGQTVIKNAFWLGVSNVGGRLIRALIIIYAARILGAAPWGAFSYAITMIAFLTTLTDFGMNSLLTRETAKLKEQPEELRKVLSTTFLIKIGLLLCGIPLVLMFGPSFTTIEDVRRILPFAALVLLFDTLREFGFSLIRAYEKMEREAALFILTNISIVIFGILFLKLSPTVESFTYAYVAGGCLGMIATFLALGRHTRELFTYFSRELVAPLMAAAWPFALAAVLGGLMVNTDVLVIGALRTAEEVGFFSAAQRILLLLYIIPGILATSSFPLFARLARKDDDKARHMLEQTLGGSLLLALPITIGGIIIGPGLIELLFGSGYLPAIIPTQILLATVPLQFIGVILGSVVFAYDAQKKLIIYAGIGGVFNVVLDIILITYWGIIGCALATLVVQIVSVGYLWWTTQKNILSFAILPQIKNSIVGTILMGVVTLALTRTALPTVVIIALSAFVYLFFLLITKERLIGNTLALIRGTPAK